MTILVYDYQDRVQLSIYSTRALFHEYFLAIKYGCTCYFDFEQMSTKFNRKKQQEKAVKVENNDKLRE